MIDKDVRSPFPIRLTCASDAKQSGKSRVARNYSVHATQRPAHLHALACPSTLLFVEARSAPLPGILYVDSVFRYRATVSERIDEPAGAALALASMAHGDLRGDNPSRDRLCCLLRN